MTIGESQVLFNKLVERRKTDSITQANTKVEHDKIIQIINEVKDSMCDSYCKWKDTIANSSAAEADKILREHCLGKCPLNRM